jgi:hypothetical protein
MNIEQTMTRTSKIHEEKSSSPSDKSNRRHARRIIHVPVEQSEDDQQTTTNNTSESYDDSCRRDQRLREIRKNLRTKYDDHSQYLSTSPLVSSPLNGISTASSPKSNDDRSQSIQIPVERVQLQSNGTSILHTRTTNPLDTRDRRYRSRTLEANQARSIDNQIYGNSSSKDKENVVHRQQRHHRLSYRRSSEDTQDKQSNIRRHRDSTLTDTNELWFDVGKEHWPNLLEHGWRPTGNTPGVHLVSFTDSSMTLSSSSLVRSIDTSIV